MEERKMKRTNRQPTIIALLIMALLLPALAEAMDFKRIVVFGTSLSDPGNAFALTGQAIKPPYSELDGLLIPPSPYVIGGHHFSNGATWIEQFARRVGRNQDVEPAFDESKDKATNYAVGGARARSDGINLNMPDQVATFLSDVGYAAPSDALYVIDMGANDVRDALASGSIDQAEIILGAALGSIGTQLGTLYFFGARKFLILNVPDLGLLPSIQILDSVFPGAAGFAGLLAQSFNYYLDFVVGSLAAAPGVEIARLDVYGKLNEIIADPKAFGLAEVAAACITPDAQPSTCPNPNSYFFWDGVHPTKAGHAIFAREAAKVLDLN
jgi:outer membrane lipase/esterase